MPHSLRAKLSGLHYKGILENKDYMRLCKALDNEDVLEQIRAEIDKAIEKEHKWLMLTRRTLCDIDIAFNGIRSAISKIILTGTPIPDNATNGDVLSSIFNIDIKNKLVHDDIDAYEITVDLGTNWTTLRINKDWWNAPYQKGGKE